MENNVQGITSAPYLMRVLEYLIDRPLIEASITFLGTIVQGITSAPYLMRVLEYLIDRPLIEASITRIVGIAEAVLDGISYLLDVLKLSLEDIIIRLLKLPGMREAVMILLMRLRPVFKGVEPEVLWVLREVLRIDGVKEKGLPIAMSIGSIFETLAEPEVIEKIG